MERHFVHTHMHTSLGTQVHTRVQPSRVYTHSSCSDVDWFVQSVSSSGNYFLNTARAILALIRNVSGFFKNIIVIKQHLYGER
jgi:hypothetical protein